MPDLYSKNYAIVEIFPQYNKIIERYNDVPKSELNYNCNSITLPPLEGIYVDFDQVCRQSKSYLNDIYHNKDNTLKEVACKYLYFWIYDKHFKNKYSTHIQTIYEELIEKSGYSNNMCQNYKIIEFTDVDLIKIKSFYDMYTCHYKIKNNDISYKQDEFCHALKKIIEEHNIQMEPKDCGKTITKQLTRESNNIKVPIIITTLVTLLISYSLLYVYKVNYDIIYLTKHCTWFQSAIKIINNKLKYKAEESNIYFPSKMSNSASRSRIYDIFYEST
ncbi:variable surface protein [Plasmodium gonderi]|uniref:Variable surface protein n=1 Tax=Plasmodium gonderi TaxID=77519 RepID=A0A1Y1JPW4_PLAGO|nr:variable surface protein [Plasmodium gonderi]GAW84250.1 variable surface protein [Plasmodium gonderi]